MAEPPSDSALATTTPAPSRGPAVEAPSAGGLASARGADTYRPAVYQPSPLWRWIYDQFFRHVHVDEPWEPTVRAAAARGLVAYVGRSVSFLDFLALDYLTKKHDLPRVQFCNDMGMSIVEPFGRGSSRLRFRRPVPEDRALAETIRQGASPLLFLRRPPALGESGSGEVEVDLIRALVEMQRRIDKPIILVPQTIVWTKRPSTDERSLTDLLFGPAEWPGRARVLLQFLFNHRNALLRTGEPFDVGAFLAEHQELTDAQAADAIRYALLRRVERERTLVLGPGAKTSTRIRDELLRSPRLRKHIEQAAKDAKRPLPAVQREAARELDRLCASPDITVIDLFHRFLDRFVWNRIYDGLVVDKEGIERVREAARRGPLVLLPSHKSHVDYLILSDALYRQGLAPPLIAAGENLSFFPLGPILRHSGAFFIRRSFKGRKLYPQLVDAYIRKVLVEGWNVEVFIEGGRSRTGKLLPPKLGILSMIIDAALQLRDRDITFVPVSIGYERIIEEGSYVRELSGGDKQPESIGGLLGAGRVLRSKYGRLYLQFGRLMSFHDVVDEALALDGRGAAGADEAAAGAADPSGTGLTPGQRRALVQRIAHRVTYEINLATVVTPAALVATTLMVHKRRGISHEQLVRSAQALLASLERKGAQVAAAVRAPAGGFRPETLEEAVRLFADAGLLQVVDDGRADPRRASPADEAIYAVPEERRIALEYHKNTILHFFVPSALIASALLALGGEAPRAALEARVRELSRLFKLEFMYRADADFGEIFEDALRAMGEDREIDVVPGDEGADVVVRRGGGAPGARVTAYAEMLRTYFEAYRIALLSLHPLQQSETASLTRKEWVKQTLALGKRRWLTGQTTLRESLSRTKLENALSAFHDLGLVRVESDVLRPATTAGRVERYAALDRMLVEHLTID